MGGHPHDHAHDHDHGHHHHHGHDHPHDHGHDHAAPHAHGEEALESLLTIFICGAFGVVAVLMGYRTVVLGQPGMLSLAIAEPFHKWVLVGGAVLLLMTLVRAVALWRATAPAAHHDHGPDCDHGGCAHGHAHDPDHVHGGIFWRAVVLLFPIVLFVLGLPNKGYSDEYVETRLGQTKAVDEAALGTVQAKEGGAVLDFAEMNTAAFDPDKRESLSGRMATIKGQFKQLGDRQFTLVRLKMTCCAADSIPLKARIVTDSSLGALGLRNMQWVEVTGRLQFVQVPGKDEYEPLLRATLRDVKPSTPE
jgi:hypothetical protein